MSDILTNILIFSNSETKSHSSLNTKKDTSEEMSCLVDQTLRISNLSFIEGLVQLQSFIEECQSFVPAPE